MTSAYIPKFNESMLVIVLSCETGKSLSENKIKNLEERKLSLVPPICNRDWGEKEQ